MLSFAQWIHRQHEHIPGHDRIPLVLQLAWVHEEISEAFKALKQQQDPNFYFDEDGKPQGFFFELADALIWILDLFAHYDVDPTTLVVMKTHYNQGRKWPDIEAAYERMCKP